MMKQSLKKYLNLKDGIKDRSITDRSLIGVTLNQFQSSDAERFSSQVEPTMKKATMVILSKTGSSKQIKKIKGILENKLNQYFPKDDPYIKKIFISGNATVTLAMSDMMIPTQKNSIIFAFTAVFIICFFIFRSVVGGLFSLIPLGVTVLFNFGLMGWAGIELNIGTVLIGMGVSINKPMER